MSTNPHTREGALVAVIQTKRHPPLWSVKVGHRYVASFLGPDARTNAETLAATLGAFEVVERPMPKRERKRLAGIESRAGNGANYHANQS